MSQFEYLTIKLTGSKGCLNADTPSEMSWENLRLLITLNGVTTVHHLAGGIAKMEEHLNHHLTRYNQQGWQTVRIEKPTEKNQIRHLKTTVHCLLKRSLKLEDKNCLNQPIKGTTKVYNNLSIRA